jgi:hypothetical protein
MRQLRMKDFSYVKSSVVTVGVDGRSYRGVDTIWRHDKSGVCIIEQCSPFRTVWAGLNGGGVPIYEGGGKLRYWRDKLNSLTLAKEIEL